MGALGHTVGAIVVVGALGTLVRALQGAEGFQELIIDLQKTKGCCDTDDRRWCSRWMVLVILMKVLVQLVMVVVELTGPLQVGLFSST